MYSDILHVALMLIDNATEILGHDDVEGMIERCCRKKKTCNSNIHSSVFNSVRIDRDNLCS